MKKCELCSKVARMYCTSDQASLCWDCDSRVHAANFLVAKHTRTLLCHACQSPTSWTGSGAKLGPTVTVCEKCVDGEQATNEVEDDDDDDDDDENEDCDEDGENQVVPLSPPPSTPSAGQEPSSSNSSSRSDRFSSSSFRFDNSRFSYNATINTREEKRGTEERSWAWR